MSRRDTENSECDITCIEGYTIASNTLTCNAVDFKTALGTWTGNVSCTPKLCSVPPSLANTLHTSVERRYLDSVTYIYKSGYSLIGLRYGKKEFFLQDETTAKMIEFSGGSLPSSSPVALDHNEWMKYQCGECHTLSGIPGSSDLFTVRCFDGDHTMTHCKPVQCGDPSVIAHATPLGGCFATITYRKQVEYQCEAGYHVESERKSGSKPEGCHAKERAEPRAGGCGVEFRRDLPHGSVSRISVARSQRTGAALGATKCLSGQFLSRALQARVRRMACVSSSAVSGETSWSVTCEKWKDANSWN